MDETRRHRHRNTNTTRSHSDVDCEKAALMEVERRRVVTRGWEGEGTGAIGRCWSMDRKLQSDSLMCCLVLCCRVTLANDNGIYLMFFFFSSMEV
jgi:hypothetical protein